MYPHLSFARCPLHFLSQKSNFCCRVSVRFPYCVIQLFMV